MLQGVTFDWTLRFGDVLALLGVAGAGIWWIWGVHGSAKAALSIARKLDSSNSELGKKVDAVAEKLDTFATKDALIRSIDDLELKLQRYVTREDLQEREKQTAREHARMDAELTLHRERLHELNDLVQQLIAQIRIALGPRGGDIGRET